MSDTKEVKELDKALHALHTQSLIMANHVVRLAELNKNLSVSGYLEELNDHLDRQADTLAFPNIKLTGGFSSPVVLRTSPAIQQQQQQQQQQTANTTTTKTTTAPVSPPMKEQPRTLPTPTPTHTHTTAAPTPTPTPTSTQKPRSEILLHSVLRTVPSSFANNHKNALSTLIGFLEKKGKEGAHLSEIVAACKLTSHQTHTILNQLVKSGFLVCESKKGLVYKFTGKI